MKRIVNIVVAVLTFAFVAMLGASPAQAVEDDPRCVKVTKSYDDSFINSNAFPACGYLKFEANKAMKYNHRLASLAVNASENVPPNSEAYEFYQNRAKQLLIGDLLAVGLPTTQLPTPQGKTWWNESQAGNIYAIADEIASSKLTESWISEYYHLFYYQVVFVGQIDDNTESLYDWIEWSGNVSTGISLFKNLTKGQAGPDGTGVWSGLYGVALDESQQLAKWLSKSMTYKTFFPALVRVTLIAH